CARGMNTVMKDVW
nr:immunoglobulin heavy chain junction region [Macaca mulatta]MOV49416.1 immunoglobulin heavy chain junction region [Macaca mulatta]MOV49506.1 immunoglobulin heavy chain junction region [Macaca mulatta]MOV49771.1 immunoglobulin heavy chain junction region [Macaca mulatta]MOV49873.1 immunoglobulin heavy chain junction region [Macaca mulatta]